MTTATFNTKLVLAAHEAAQNYANAVRNEMELEDNRVNVKMAAIKRIIDAGDNALTGKPHSFSSAEAVVNADKEYAQYLEKLRNAAVERILAKAAYEVALLEGKLNASN